MRDWRCEPGSRCHSTALAVFRWPGPFEAESPALDSLLGTVTGTPTNIITRVFAEVNALCCPVEIDRPTEARGPVGLAMSWRVSWLVIGALIGSLGGSETVPDSVRRTV